MKFHSELKKKKKKELVIKNIVQFKEIKRL